MHETDIPRVRTRHDALASGSMAARAGRVEPRDSGHSLAVFFEEADGAWHPVPDAPRCELQDPFATFIGGELVFGGVAVRFGEGLPIWWTEFCRGADIFSLERCFAGPVEGMEHAREHRRGIDPLDRGGVNEAHPPASAPRCCPPSTGTAMPGARRMLPGE